MTLTGLANDAILDKANHGGVDQAVYIYTLPDYDWWSAELGRPCDPGLFGENLTVSGLESASVCVGDRYRIGDVLLEVTSPRIPCSTFAARMGDSQFVKRFMAGKRPGIYCRVLETGSVKAGVVIAAEPFNGEQITLLELFEGFPHKSVTSADRDRYLSVPAHWKLAAFLKGEIAKP